MRKNRSEAENSIEKQKKGTPRGHLVVVSPFLPSLQIDRKVSRAAKSSVDYWKERVRPRTLKDGTQTAELYVRLKESGRDAWVCLDTANRAAAASKARDLWQTVQVKGLVAAVAEFHPKSDTRPERSATVGELLTAARSLSTVQRSTFTQYEISLRRLVAGVLGMKATGSVFYHKSDEAKKWRARIEGASLDLLTPARIELWKKSHIAAAPDEVARLSARNTVAATLRNARGFFTPALVPSLRAKIRLPDPLPLAGVAIGGATRRFKPTVDPRKIYADAWKELSGDALTAFLLCIIAGLRRGEADMLPWAHVDTDASIVHVMPTKWFLPKTEESQRSTPIPPDVAAYLKTLRAANPDAEFVLSGLDPAKKRGAKEYRCEPCWTRLLAWLRSKGFASKNPVHELRKSSGSFVNAAAGLEAARRHLGHRNVATTAASYVAGSAAVVDLSGKAKGAQ